MTDTIIMPLHNDDQVLKYSLNCLKDFKGQVVFVLDNCSEQCEELVRRFCLGRNGQVVTKKGFFKTPNPAWDSFLYGTRFANGDRVFWIGADIVFDSRIFREDLAIPCKFQYIDADNHFMFAWFKFLSIFSKHYCLEVFPRDFPFERYSWVSEEEMPPSRGSAQIKFKLENSVILHLRRNRNRARSYIQGRVRYQNKTSAVKVFLHSVLLLKPHVIIGYLHELFSASKPFSWLDCKNMTSKRL